MKPHISMEPTIRQDQRLVMSVAMEKAFHVLMLPTLELAEWIENEIEQNPLLEIIKANSKPFDPQMIAMPPTLHDHLEREIALHFTSKEEKRLARMIAGSLDDKGFTTLTEEELKGMEEIHRRFLQMEPLGIGARSVQEALLVQIEGAKGSMLYQIIETHYLDLVSGKLEQVAKRFHFTSKELSLFLKIKLRTLHPYPAHPFKQVTNQDIYPDLLIEYEEGAWSVAINNSILPTFHINPRYLEWINQCQSSKEDQQFIRRHLASGKWLSHILEKRKHHLQLIGAFLLKEQLPYFEGRSLSPKPMTMKKVAIQLNLSESTITRTIANKVISSPRGLLPLRKFFSSALQAKEGPISSDEVKRLISLMISQETEPLTDGAIAKALEKKGITCARRTIAKYRKSLRIASAAERKRWK
ncbi:MAG: RNA polymerase factor sigma-54 [Chlamydiia bacterium]|nr:RNA polymerase factor sigma-54 [Chlamydiia bacterium]